MLSWCLHCNAELFYQSDIKNPSCFSKCLFDPPFHVKGPGSYKIPSFNDTPQDFLVHLMDKWNKRAVHSSKGIGEPPFFLGCSVYLQSEMLLQLLVKQEDCTITFL